ncbi:MAG: Gfo/Idh/MocA family oxidoreductase [Lachnospiraceae bacterium]
MKKINIGILGTSEIAFRRFIPSLLCCDFMKYIGVASRTIEQTEKFVQSFGGKGYGSYEDLLRDKEIDAVYIPLPPALHYTWAKLAIQSRKHVLVEKPFTTNLKDAQELIRLSQEYNVAIFENYMFQYHPQIREIKEAILCGEIGEIRLIRSAFGFPLREPTDFRYNAELGGGALLDAGGYVAKLATIMLGKTIKVDCAMLKKPDDYEVDMYGNVTFSNGQGVVFQGAFGMDCYYQCNLEVWGTRGKLVTDRIYTAPADYTPVAMIQTSNEQKVQQFSKGNHFIGAIKMFYESIKNDNIRKDIILQIEKQMELVDDIRKEAEKNYD